MSCTAISHIGVAGQHLLQGAYPKLGFLGTLQFPRNPSIQGYKVKLSL